MILQEYLDVNITSKNMKYYKDLGYDINGKGIYSIKNEDVQLGSKVLETRQCDCCGQSFERKRRQWTDSFEAHGKDLCSDCGRKANQEKIKQNNLKNYGVEFPMQSKEVRNKAKETSLKKYGVEHPLQSSIAKENRKKIMKEKYGVDNIRQIDGVNEKIKQTNLKKYGCENQFGNKDVKNKIKQTNIIKYGCENPSQNIEIQKKKEATTFKNYGVNHPFQNEEVHNRAKKTWLKNLGVDNPFKSKKVRAKGLITLSKKDGVLTSKQQIELYERCLEWFPEYSVKLNPPVSELSLDIEIEIDNNIKIDLEYDGWYWHHLRGKQDYARDVITKSLGYRIIRVQAGRLLPTKEQLQDCINYVLQDGHSFSKITLQDWIDLEEKFQKQKQKLKKN